VNRDAMGLLIRGHEGTRRYVYQDTRGILTGGIGCNLQRAGIRERLLACGADADAVLAGTKPLTHDQVEALFADDLNEAIAGGQSSVRNFAELPTGVQSAVVDMVFDMGVSGFRKFVRAIKCLEVRDFAGAALQMEHSLWATQVPNRAASDIALVRAAAK
jgi:GH24 family phage-related lysozyme (muramidase)